MRCSICIATYRRPKLLKKLLISLSNQQVPGNWEKEIVIVDNDAYETARPVFKQFANNSQNIKYFVQPVKNISLTRNEAVKNAGGDYLVFIDDDEHADPNWLKNLIETIENYKADVVIGRIFSNIRPIRRNGLNPHSFSTVLHLLQGKSHFLLIPEIALSNAALLKNFKDLLI